MKPKSQTLLFSIPTRVVFSFSLVMAGLGFQSTQAADQSWSTTPASANFSGINWTPGQVPGAASSNVASTDSLYFGTSTVTSLINDNNAFTYAGLTFKSGAPAFTLLGNSFTLSGGITNNSSSLQTITNSLALSATQSIDTSSGNVTLNGVISGATFGLNKSTAGTLTLAGVNTYTGANTFSGGTVAIGLDTNLGATGATVSLSGTTLKANLGASITDTHVVTVAGASTINVNSPLITNFTFAFNTAATLGGSGALTVTGNGSLDVSGANSGVLVLNSANVASGFTGTLTMQSGGLLEYNVNNVLPSGIPITLNGNGGMSVNNGTNAMANNVTVTNAGNILNFGNGNGGIVTGGVTLNSDLTVGMRDWYNWATARNGAINGVISGVGGLIVQAPGNPLLTLGAANTYSGATTLFNAGLTLTANATSSISGSSGINLCNSVLTASYASGIVDKFKDTGTLSMRNNSSIALTGNAADTTETIGVLEIAGGNNTITLTTSGTAVTTLAASSLNRTNLGAGLLIGSSLGQLNLSASKISLTTPPSGANLVGAGGAPSGLGSVTNLGIVPWLAGNPSAAGTAGLELVTYDTSLGSLRPLLAAEYDAAGTIAGAASGTNVKSANVSETGLSSATLNALVLAPTAGQTITGNPGATLTISSGSLTSAMASGLIGTAAFNSTISGFDAVAFGNGEAVIRTSQSGGSITINSPISVTAGGGLTKAGPGTLTLGAANTYTGTTYITQLALATTVNNVFNGATGTPMVLSNNAQFNLNATTQKISTLTFNGAGNGGGSIIGTSGTLDLGGDVAFESALTNENAGVGISVGTLNLNGNRAFNIGDALSVTGPEMSISSIIADGTSSSNLTKTGSGTLLLTGANTYGGGTTISGGTLQIGVGTTIGSITGNVVNNGILNFNRSDAVAFGSVSGSGDLFQSGAGTTTLSGTAISTGKVIVRNATLSVPALNGTGAIEIGSGGTAIGLTYTGTGENTSRALTLTGTTGGVTLTQNGTGLLKFTSDVAVPVSGSRTVTLTGTGNGEIAGRLVDSPNGVTTITKAGTGTWTLSGPNTNTGPLNVNAGALNLSGSLGNNSTNGQFKVGTVASTPAVLNVLPGAAASRFNLFVGDAGGGTGGGAVYQSGGSLLMTQGAGADNLRIGSNAGGYGYYRCSGGTLVANEIGIGASLADTIGVMDVSSAGTVSTSGWITMGRGSATSSGLLNVTGGTVNASRIDMNWGTNAAALCVLNVSGGNVNVTGAGTGITLANASTTAGVQGIVNLLGGTLTTTII
ncbi:MAG: autotransporter-associated beta strand repeat-containing protein [Luteolibacter sp.]